MTTSDEPECFVPRRPEDQERSAAILAEAQEWHGVTVQPAMTEQGRVLPDDLGAETLALPPDEARPWSELRSTGLLWLVNRQVFHPRGFALALVADAATGEIKGWRLLGDGREPWRFDGSEDEHFANATETLTPRAADPDAGRIDR